MSNQGLTVEQAAAALGKSEKTIRRYIDSGKIKAEKHKGAYRILEIPEQVTRQKPPGQTGQKTVQSGQREQRVTQVTLIGEIERLSRQVGYLTAENARLKNLLEAPKRLPWYKRGFFKWLTVAGLFVVVGLGLSLLFEQLGVFVPAYVSLPIFFAAVVADHTTTMAALKSGGYESNPVLARLFRQLGISKAFLVILGILALFACIVWGWISPAAQLAIALAFFVVPITNVVTRAKLKHS